MHYRACVNMFRDIHVCVHTISHAGIYRQIDSSRETHLGSGMLKKTGNLAASSWRSGKVRSRCEATPSATPTRTSAHAHARQHLSTITVWKQSRGYMRIYKMNVTLMELLVRIITHCTVTKFAHIQR